jgi:hypothetical protein
LIAIQDDIFNTPADHIAFAVHWRNSEGYLDNSNGGFAGEVAERFWPELANLEFEKGVPISKKFLGKWWHACPVHTNEKGGWDESPILIEECFNKIPCGSTEVIASVLMGGGHAGNKYKATVNNLEGFIKTYKTVVLYVKDQGMYDLLIECGIVAKAIPQKTSLISLPKVYKYGEKRIVDLLVG